MKYIIFISIVFFLSCSVLNNRKEKTHVRKMTFSVESIFGDLAEMTDQFESYIEIVDSSEMSDSFNIKMQNLMKKKIENESEFPNEIYLEITKEGWIRQRYFSNRYTNLLEYNQKSDSIRIVSNNTNKEIGKYKLKRDSCTYEIEIDKHSTKNVHGFDCYYIKLEEFYGDSEFRALMGSTIYEMWVTEDLELSTYSLLKNECNVEGFVPLEVKFYQSTSKGNYHKYILTKTE